MERVSTVSAALLQLESRAGQMHVGFLARVDAGPGGASLDVEVLRQRIARRLERTPRLRQVVAPIGERDGRLVWRQQRDFALARHVSVCDAPVGGEEQLRAVVDAFLARELERDRPLWHVLVVPSAGSGGAAIVAVAHRALYADAGSAAEPDLLRALIFDRAAPAGGGHAGGAGGGARAGAAGAGGAF
ncbi:wax ester/triacylglycerol synthase domain-containing protein, partial [Conexibacter sp. CPCC 205762]